MNAQQPLDARLSDDNETRTDSQLRLLRVLWQTTFVLILLLYLIGLPVYYSQILMAPSAPAANVADPALPASALVTPKPQSILRPAGGMPMLLETRRPVTES